ncbi:hypothetical protein [Actibacterium sp. MT2.3-13A]|uniref:hypothetical protein n=1 Tax=Actibacterium sp. MT2.3-13A TaxID=2828332 RepID=UPI001BA5D459|nr:hypothetical protein [Actibacterium sp. MT2.3-13A]
MFRNSCHDRLDEAAPSVFAEFLVRAFDLRAAGGDLVPKRGMCGHVTREAGDVVDDDDAVCRVCLPEIGEQGVHPRALGIAPRDDIGEDFHDLVVLTLRVFAAASLLTGKAGSVAGLLGRGNPRIDDALFLGKGIGGFDDHYFTFH